MSGEIDGLPHGDPSRLIAHRADGVAVRRHPGVLPVRGSRALPMVDRTQPNAPATSAPVAAAGSITFAANPTAGQTLTLNGSAITFVTSGATGLQVNVGATTDATITSLVALLGTTGDAALAAASYWWSTVDVTGNFSAAVLYITHRTPGAAGNAFALATTTSATLSGATLAGGVDSRQMTMALSQTNPLSSGARRAAVTRVNSISVLGCSDMALLGGGDFQAYSGGTAPLLGSLVARSVQKTATFRAANVLRVAVNYYGSGIVFAIKGVGSQTASPYQSMRVKVNDQDIIPQRIIPPVSTLTLYLYIPFASAAWRRIDVILDMDYTQYIDGIFMGVNDIITPAQSRGPRVIVVGDSYINGTTYCPTVDCWPQHFADAMGWDNVWPSGVGGTGFMATGGGSLPTYGQRMATDVYPYSPDLIILQPSVNDWTGGYTTAQVLAAVSAVLDDIAVQAPQAEVWMTSNLPKGGVETMVLSHWAQHDGIKAICDGRGIKFLNVIESALPIGVTGATATLTSAAAQFATTIQVDAPLAIGGTYRLSDGSRIMVRGITGTGPYTVTIGSQLLEAKASGLTLRAVGGSLWTGGGKVGSPSGWGSSDIMVSPDGVHPSLTGAQIIGCSLAQLAS